MGILALGDGRGWVRAMLATRDKATTSAQVDAAYRALVARHGEPVVLAAADTLKEFWYSARYRESPQTADKWRQIHGLRQGGVPKSDHELLTEMLAKGAVAVLGDPGSARTADDRIVLAGESQPEGWPRRAAVFQGRWQLIEDVIIHDTLRYPNPEWLSTRVRLNHVGQRYQTNERTAQPNARLNAQLDHTAGVYLHDAIKTLQVHCFTSGEPAGDACKLLELAEKEFGDLWPQLLAEHRERPSTDPSVVGGLHDLLGSWGGQYVPHGGHRGAAVTLQLVLPKRAGESYGTVEYPAIGCTGRYFFIEVQGGVYYFREKMNGPPGACRGGVIGLSRVAGADRLHWYWYADASKRPFFYSGGLASPPSFAYYGGLERVP